MLHLLRRWMSVLCVVALLVVSGTLVHFGGNQTPLSGAIASGRSDKSRLPDDFVAGNVNLTSRSEDRSRSRALTSAQVRVFGERWLDVLDVPTGLDGAIAVGAGYQHFLVVKSDNTVVAWGVDDDGRTAVPAGLTDVVAVAGGRTFSLALKRDGSVVAWGKMRTYADPAKDWLDTTVEAYVPAGLTDVRKIVANGSLAVAIKNDGTIVQWGVARCQSGDASSTCPDGRYALVLPPAGLTNVLDVAIRGGGNPQVVAIQTDGTVVQWGDTSYNENIPTSVVGARNVAMGEYHGIILTTANTITTWGSTDYEQARGLIAGYGRIPPTPYTFVAAGQFMNFLGVDGGKSIAAWGETTYGAAELDMNETVTAFAANHRYAIYLVVAEAPTATPTTRAVTLTRTATAGLANTRTRTATSVPVVATKTRTKTVTKSRTPTKPGKPTKTPTKKK